jgi:DNA-binding XRE family transcriptional regulator
LSGSFTPVNGRLSGKGSALDKFNNIKQIRESQMMSKAELARKAKVTVQTIDRIEKGNDCRLDTKRKIILALGYDLTDRSSLFESNGEAKK